MGIKFIYFDIGGVLFHWKTGLVELSNFTGKSYDEVFETFNRHDGKACIGEVTPKELWELSCEDLEIDNTKLDDFSDFWVNSCVPVPSMHKVIKELIKIHRVGLITNIYYESFDKMTKQDLVPNLDYEVVIQSCDVGMIKPSQEIFELSQSKLGDGIARDEVLFIDDSKENIKKAEEFGWRGFKFDDENEETSAKELGKMFGIDI